jgi:hypothetical protein
VSMTVKSEDSPATGGAGLNVDVTKRPWR